MTGGMYRIFLHSRRTLGVGPRRFWWSVISRRNAKVILHSEMYTTRAARDDTVTAFLLSADEAFHDVFDVDKGAPVVMPRPPVPR